MHFFPVNQNLGDDSIKVGELHESAAVAAHFSDLTPFVPYDVLSWDRMYTERIGLAQ